jgi:antitoxin ParD1/3/4
MASTLNISLPEPLTAYVLSRVESGELSSPTDYIVSLIRDDMQRNQALEERLVAALHQGHSITLSSDEVERGGIVDQLRQKMADRQSRAA